MKRSSVAVFLFALLICVLEAYVPDETDEHIARNADVALRTRRMVGGLLTPGHVPWHALVYLSDSKMDGGIGGGALIGPRWILTAGRNLFVRKTQKDTRGKEPLIPKVYLGVVQRSKANASMEVAVEKFWAAYVPCETKYKYAVRLTLQNFDVIHLMRNKYANDFMFAATSQDIQDAFAKNKTACLIGVEGGHSIDSSMATLRTMYQLGVRYMTLTHSCNTPWADNWLVDTGSDPVQNNGLSEFGKRLVGEMNRMGMMVDLAHVPEQVMTQVLEISKAPVIFSHSSAYGICPHKRNVPDYILQKVKDNNGIVMVNFYNDYVTCGPKADLSNVADHFDHIKKGFGSSIVGFGGDYDGVSRMPTGLEDVSKYPDLVVELLKRGWTDDEVKDALGRNLIRVFKAVEAVRDSLNSTDPDDIPIPLEQVQNPCRTDYGYRVQPNNALMTTHCSILFVSTQILYLLIDKLI